MNFISKKAEPAPFWHSKRSGILVSVLAIVTFIVAAFFASQPDHAPRANASASPALISDLPALQANADQLKHSSSQRINATSVQRVSTQNTSSPTYLNLGLSNDNNALSRAEANFDGGGYSYSMQALGASKLWDAEDFYFDGVHFIWPIHNQATDNVVAGGQTLTITPVANAKVLGFLGSASGGDASGTATLTYSDGTQQKSILGMSDWTLGGGTRSPDFGNQIVTTQLWRNNRAGSQSVKTYLFYAKINLLAGKTIVSITLPTTTGNARLHLFDWETRSDYVNPYNNVGMSDDGYPNPGNFDGSGNSYTADQGPWYPGQYNNVVLNDFTFWMPDVLGGVPDNYEAHGQTIPINHNDPAVRLGFVGAATGGPSYGTATINYTDGTQQPFTLGFSDWTLNAFTQAPSFNNQYFYSYLSRNTPRGKQNVPTFLFLAQAPPLLAGKNVASVTLPSSTNQGHIHIFSIATTSNTQHLDNLGTTSDKNPLFGNFDGGHHSYSVDAMKGYEINLAHYFADDLYMSPSNDSLPDNMLVNGQTVQVNGSGAKLSFLGSSTGGASSGTGTIHYTDGTSQNFTLGFTDWCASVPQFNNQVMATFPYRNSPQGKQWIANSVFNADVPLQPNKYVSDVVLPQTTGGQMHIFALGVSHDFNNNNGISDDTATFKGNFDGAGASYSDQALQAVGWKPGFTYVHNNVSVLVPYATAGLFDNTRAMGQTIPVTAGSSGTTLAFLGSAHGGAAAGKATITYTDGTTQDFQLGFTDWCASTTSFNNTVAVLTHYRNKPGGKQTLNTSIYYTDVALDASKVIQSVTLPVNDHIHIFAIGTK
ncbi:hypothetical protein [Dictyobacter kobayashii]|uniref:Uncharacterized protein n=1 Tax=Dictyobacter kobayashii TaxID=2014872 RepID=A0A402AIF2_9CHLR|nr:hypothetical protein [Dictyobacter kobayashii]GCE18886.1 hypothetical protein KDK_26860 [Dictyobacter kobayashii]